MSGDSRLQKWANAHAPDEKMLWKSAYWDQIIFIRDSISGLLSRTYKEYKDLVDVTNTHRSKSIECPVYFIDLKRENVKIWMRYNYYDWNISIESEKPINCDFIGTFNDESGYGYCFCQGMEDKKFGMYKDNNRKFTVCIGSDYDLYTFFRVLRNHLGIKKED